MQRVLTNAHICLGLVSITICLLLLMELCGLIPDAAQDDMAARIGILRVLATDATIAIQRDEPVLARQLLQSAVMEVPFLRGCRLDLPLRRLEVGNTSPKDSMAITVPVCLDGRYVGNIHFYCHFPPPPTLISAITSPFGRMLTMLALLQLAAYWIFVARVLDDLNLSRIVPARIVNKLNLLAEGLVVMDRDQRIVLANKAFAETVGKDPVELIDTRLDALPWTESPLQEIQQLPWENAVRQQEPDLGATMRFQQRNGNHRAFRVNAVPLMDESDQCRGALATFDDVTGLEERTVVLTRMLARLKASRDHIRDQNQQLHRMATRDPLTSALNRWSFFEQFDSYWSKIGPGDPPISCILIDVDYFKKINDTYGHAKGDFVLTEIVKVLHGLVRSTDLVCRYGGEEFCVVFPHTTESQAAEHAECLRQGIHASDFQGLSVTASFGVACSASGAESTQQLMDQADQALYAAKRMGRNQVVRYSNLPSSNVTGVGSARSVAATSNQESAISCQIVAALTSALAYRDAATAEHSRRVADLCVRLARDLMPLSACYVLENAALLHDVGKIGVPDSILLKPGPLAENEWSIMRSLDQMGVDIIRSTFACEQLTQIVRCHLVPFNGDGAPPGTPVGKDIPLPARILAVCDAYDAMVTDRVFRPGMAPEQAFAELRRCSGTQFDPEIVERFIGIVGDSQPCQNIDTTHVSKTAALRLGVQIESLARAIDAEDIMTLRELTRVVRETAQEFQIAPVESMAHSLITALEGQHEWVATVRLTLDLMELCRQTQRTHLATLRPV